MPFRFWPRRPRRKQLESRVRRLEKDRKQFTTITDVWKYWNDMATANGLITRIGELEKQQGNANKLLGWMMEDIGKLKKLLPNDDEDDDEGAASGRPATVRTVSSGISGQNNVGPRTDSPVLSPTETPVTFTRRKSNSAERVTLDDSSLRLP